MIPHEVPAPGPAADFAHALARHLPVLETERLRLRAPRLEDFPAWAEILCGPAGPYLGGPFTRDEAFTEFTANVGLWLLRGYGTWAVETQDEALLGFVLLGFEAGDREPELGFLFTPAAEGQGFAYEAAVAARDHAVQVLRLPGLVSYTDPENARANRLAERLGARREEDFDGAHVWRHAGGRA
ncbi:MAG: GNAT family N-acetyltransferase [Pseudomonadota bacterium]